MIKKIISIILVLSMLSGFGTAFANSEISIFEDQFDNGMGVVFFAYEYDNVYELISSTKQFGDYAKALRAEGGKPGWFTYKMDKITGFTAENITQNDDDIYIEFYTSPDNENWTKHEPEIIDMGRAPWQGFRYEGENLPEDTKYLKVQIPDVPGEESWNKQLLNVCLTGVGDPYLREDYVPEKTEVILPDVKSAVSFKDDFDSLENAVIKKSEGDKIQAVTRYGKSSFEVFHQKKDASSEIRFEGVGAEARSYKLSLSLMPVDKNASRTVSIADENGILIPLAGLNEGGEVGYYNSGIFTAFPKPLYYETNNWLDLEASFSASGSLKIKVSGEEVLSNTDNVFTMPSEKISGIVITDSSKSGESRTYYDYAELSRLSAYREGGAQTLSIDRPIMKDVNEHKNKDNIQFLVKKGIISGNGSFYFRPEDNIAYDAFLKMLMMSVGPYSTETASYWAQPYIDMAKAQGISFDGIDMSREITRAEAAELIAKLAAEETSAYYDMVSERIRDISGLSEEIKGYIIDTVSKGIMSLDKSKAFNPASPITRSEAATIAACILDSSRRIVPVYRVGIYPAKKNTDGAEKLLSDLNKEGYAAEILTEEDMTDESELSPSNYSCVILFNNLVNTEKGISVMRKYLQCGGDLVTAGEELFDKFNNNVWQLPIYEGFDYETYRIKDAAKVVTAGNQEIIDEDVEVSGNFEGVSAVGFLFAASSTYIPVLEAKNKYGQHVGHAAGVMTNYGGQYKDSDWLIYGIGNEEFYDSEGFTKSLISALDTIDSEYLSENWNQEAIREKNRIALENFEITEPKPEGMVTVDKEQGILLGLDGEPLFLFGANTYGLAEFFWGMGDDATDDFDIQKLEYVFKMAKDIGVNCFRLWEAPTKGKRVDVIKHLARKYGVYIYLLCNSVDDHETSLKMLEEYAATYGDEPMIIGYDLKNEPHGLFDIILRVAPEENPIVQSDIMEKCKIMVEKYRQSINWLLANDQFFVRFANQKLFTKDQLEKLAAAEMVWRREILEGAQVSRTVTDANIKPNLNSDQQYVLSLINDTFRKYFENAAEIVHKYDPGALITVGYLNAATLVPANEVMGFQNLHGYTYANSKKDVQEALDGMDSMKKNLPSVPVVYGEFCYSAGQTLANGELADYNVACLGEVAHWLYSYAQNYSGAVIWCLQEWNPTNYRWDNSYYSYADGSSWNPLDGLRRERQGLYYYAGGSFADGGEPMYKPKASAVAMKFFSDYFMPYHKPGDGELVLTDAKNQAETGFLFTADTAEYAANTSYKTDRLSFESEKSPMVMVDWSDGKLRMLATQETVVKVKPSAYVKEVDTKDIKIEGLAGEYEVQGDYLVIKLLKDEVITLN